MGLGTLVTLIATSTAADVTGVLAASALSVVGLLVLPAKKRRAKQELNYRRPSSPSTESTRWGGIARWGTLFASEPSRGAP